MLDCRYAIAASLAAIAPALTSVGAAGPTPVIEPLILEGDALGGFVVSTVKKPSINNDGTWLVEVDTSGPQGADEMIVRNGVVLLTEDEPVAAPAGAVVESFDGLALDNAGNSLLGMFLDGTGGFDNNAGIYFNDQLVKQLADLMDAPGLSPGTPFSNLRDVKLNDARLALVVGSVSDPNIPGSGDEAIFTIDTTTGEETLLAIESGLLPGSPDAVLQFLAEPQHSALNNQGVAAFMVDFVGDNASDIAIYVGGDLIAREGDPSPIPGRNWTGLAIGLDINNSGGHAFTGRLDGDPSTEIVVMANGQVIAQEGDLSPSGHVIDVFSSLVRIDDNNNVLWYGDWSSPDFDTDSAIFLNDQVLVCEGVSTAGGVVIDSMLNINLTDGFDISDNGQWVIFTGALEDGRQGAFRIQLPPAPSPCPGDATGDNMVDSADLNAVLAGFGGPGPGGDTNNDGVVDSTDLNAVLAGFGSVCP